MLLSDHKSKKGPQDRNRINLSEDYEVEYWSEKYGISTKLLRIVVHRVGPMVTDVERELHKRL